MTSSDPPVAPSLNERSERNLRRLAACLGLHVDDFRAREALGPVDGHTVEILCLWSALDCLRARGRVLDLLRAEVARRIRV